LGKGFLTVALLGVSGCLGFLHPIEPPRTEHLESCQAVPKCCRDHVYVFLINGLDPVNYGNLAGVQGYLNSLGISKTYYGQIYHLWSFAGEIRRISREDPDARFVLVGFSLGVNLVDALARMVQPDGVHIDLLVFLSGNHPVQPMPGDRPDNVDRVINLLASGLMATRGERDWAENLRIPHSLHFDTPTHPLTLEQLAQEMAALAATVPVTEAHPPPLPPSDEEAPPPHPMKVRSSARRGDWDFLKPVARLKPMADDDFAQPERGGKTLQYPVSH
jgi:hypothetical protein